MAPTGCRITNVAIVKGRLLSERAPRVLLFESFAIQLSALAGLPNPRPEWTHVVAFELRSAPPLTCSGETGIPSEAAKSLIYLPVNTIAMRLIVYLWLRAEPTTKQSPPISSRSNWGSPFRQVGISSTSREGYAAPWQRPPTVPANERWNCQRMAIKRTRSARSLIWAIIYLTPLAWSNRFGPC